MLVGQSGQSHFVGIIKEMKIKDSDFDMESLFTKTMR